jgi:tetratricopeptide (TPR) repeat protein
VLLILCVPLITWPLVKAGQVAWGPDLLASLILLTATGHYFATFARAYGDRELFQRFRTRFLLTPVVLLVTFIAMFASGNGPSLVLVTTGWAFWHWLAQAFGFARIYDIKVGSFGRWTSRLDKALVISWFVGAVVLTDGATAEFASVVLQAGLPLPNAAQFDVVQIVVVAAMVVAGVAYLANLITTIVRKQPWSWQKQVMHVMTIGYYWFAFAWLPNVVVAYVLYEFFHDIQYYAITWLTCRQRVRRPGTTSWLSRMFRPSWIATLGFVLLMTACGGMDILGRNFLYPEGLNNQVWMALILTFAILHYYYDGFIWKARENTLGSDLGINSGLRAVVVPGLRHAASWGFFFVPIVAVMAFGTDGLSKREQTESLVALAPGDFLNQAELGLELAMAGELPAAIECYEKSIAIYPGLAQSRANFGAALDLSGDLDGAREQYEAAFACRDQNGAHSRAHINLGVILLVQGERELAQVHFDAGHKLGGEAPVGRMMGMAAQLPPGAEKRQQELYAAVLLLDPEQLEARYNVASRLLAQGRFEQAARDFRFLVERSPQVTLGMIGLAKAQVELGQVQEARLMVARVLQINKSDPDALALHARLNGR